MTCAPQTARMAALPQRPVLDLMPVADIAVSADDLGDYLHITLAGELDLLGAHMLRLVAEPELVVSRRHLVIDVEHVSFCDVAGLNALLALCDLAAVKGCEMRLRRPSAALQRLFEVTGTTTSFSTTGC